jgi:hypothetical protein
MSAWPISPETPSRMSFVSALLYPFLLLFPAAGASDAAQRDDEAKERAEAPLEQPADAHAWPRVEIPGLYSDAPVSVSLLPEATPQDAWQLRIEQRMTIRITPRSSVPLPDMFAGMPGDDEDVHLTERKIGKCIQISGIGSVRPDRDNRLLLFMRDRRLVSAELDRSCRARDFYSGFYLQRSDDGRLCVDRDTLLSRSGMNCKLTRIRELVEADR